MDCDQAREAISAHLDGAAESSVARVHVSTCADCRRWEAEAASLRRAGLHAAPTVDPPALGALRPAHFQRNRWLRVVLAWAGVLLVAWSAPGVITGGEDDAVTHLFRHQAAFSAALGVTFLLVAWRPDRAYGLVPFAATFTVALGATAIIDLVGGSSDPGPEARHLVEIAGLVVLWILGIGAGPRRRKRRPTRTPDARHLRDV